LFSFLLKKKMVENFKIKIKYIKWIEYIAIYNIIYDIQYKTIYFNILNNFKLKYQIKIFKKF